MGRRLRKWGRRHRAGVLTAAGLALGAVLGVADLSGAATIDNVASGLDSGLVRLLYAGGKQSTITYLDVDQVFTSPPAG